MLQKDFFFLILLLNIWLKVQTECFRVNNIYSMAILFQGTFKDPRLPPNNKILYEHAHLLHIAKKQNVLKIFLKSEIIYFMDICFMENYDFITYITYK